ncbi:MAG: four helix bundle protein [Chitinophagales bacterium]
MTHQFSFEKLSVWQDARFFVKEIYQITKSFPREEQFGLTSQIRRAAVSVCSNLAEGTARISMKEQARFTEIAYGSLIEVLNQLIIAVDLDFYSEKELNIMRPKIEKLSNQINALRKMQIKRFNSSTKNN